MALELRQARYFVTVAEELHFGRAAERLHVAQSALSQQIQSLENHLGARLLNRSKRSAVTLTNAGVIFLQEARALLRQAERAEAVGRQAGRGERGRIEIGYVASAAFSGFMPAVLLSFHRDRPSVEVRLQEMETPRQLAAIAEGTLDVGFVRTRPAYPNGVTAVPVTSERLIVALPIHHPLVASGGETIPLESLAEEAFIVPQFNEATGFREYLNSIAVSGGFDIRIGQNVRDFLTAISLVAAGCGIAVVPQSLRCLAVANVVYRSIDKVTLHAELAFAFRKAEREPIVRKFIDQVTSNRMAGKSEL